MEGRRYGVIYIYIYIYNEQPLIKDKVLKHIFHFQGTGEMINTKFFCRLCALLHEPRSINPGHHYDDCNQWWRGKGTCINGSWNKFYAALEKDRKAITEKKSLDEAKASSNNGDNDTKDNDVQVETKSKSEEKKGEVTKVKDEDKSLDFEDIKP